MKLDRDRLTLLGVRTNDSENLVSEALAKTDELLNSWPHVRKYILPNLRWIESKFAGESTARYSPIKSEEEQDRAKDP